MIRSAWVVALAAAAAIPVQAQTPTRAPITVSKVVTSIPDSAEWAQGGPTCAGQEHLRWNVGKSVIDVSRFAQPVRNELRHEGLTVAADPADPFGGSITSDLMLGATITGLAGKLCGGNEVTGEVQMQVLWQVYSNAQKKVVTSVRTTVTQLTRDKPVLLVRLLDGAMGSSAKQLLLNGSFEAVLVTGAGGAPAAGPDGGPGPSRPPSLAVPPVQTPLQYGPGVAHGDLVPHAQERLAISGLAGRGMKITDSVQSVPAIMRPGSVGSAFLISRDGYLLTAAHVVGAETFVKVHWADGYETTGEVVRRDNRRDVALIRTDAHGRPPLPVVTRAPEVGGQVYAIGAPGSLQGTVTRGIVSADRTLDGFSFIQSDAAVNPGNSGGPLLNEHGEVLGIADLSNRANPGINFFVPMADTLLFLGLELR